MRGNTYVCLLFLYASCNVRHSACTHMVLTFHMASQRFIWKLKFIDFSKTKKTGYKYGRGMSNVICYRFCGCIVARGLIISGLASVQFNSGVLSSFVSTNRLLSLHIRLGGLFLTRLYNTSNLVNYKRHHTGAFMLHLSALFPWAGGGIFNHPSFGYG